MDYAKTKPWASGQFAADGDRMQPAEYILEYEHGRLAQTFFVLRNSIGECCGIEREVDNVCGNCLGVGHGSTGCTGMSWVDRGILRSLDVNPNG
jgi:hypothetical protein